MLIIPFLNLNQSLFLDAYSYQLREIEAVAFVLRQVVETLQIINLERDRMDRLGKRHVIAFDGVPRLEERLGLRFQGEGPTTSIIVKPLGAGYRCMEISAHGSGTGCINMSAMNQADATVKCALIAGHNAWFGGEAVPGQCPDPLTDIIRRIARGRS